MKYYFLLVLLLLTSFSLTGCASSGYLDTPKSSVDLSNDANIKKVPTSKECFDIKNLKRTKDKIYYLNKSNRIFCVKNDLKDYITDAIKIVKNGITLKFNKNKKIIDGRSINAHRDGIQLVPNNSLAMGKMTDITIMNPKIISPNSLLQGIFASDGIFERIKIINPMISTKSSHGITINGLLSGEIQGSDLTKNAIIRLNPLRVGGGKFIWIVQENKFLYKPIKGLDTSNEHRVRDYRLAFTKGNKKITKRFWEQNVKGDSRPNSTVVYKQFPTKLFLNLIKSSSKYASAKSSVDKAEIIVMLTLKACKVTNSCIKLADKNKIYKFY